MQQDAIFREGRFAGALAVCALLWLPAACARGAVAGGARATVTHAVQRAPGYLGIEFHDLTNAQAEAMHLRGPRGVEVVLVDHDGPAAKAGLRPQDLITGLNGHIVSSGEALRRMIHDAGAGVEVRLSVFRNGDPITIRAKLANREQVARQAWERVIAPPASDGEVVAGFTESYTVEPQPAPVKNQTFLSTMLHIPPFTGLVVQAMQPQLAAFFGAPRGEGLLVQAVDAGSPAATAGLRAGDVILRAEGETVRSIAEWNKRLYEGKGRPISLTVLRERHEMTVTMQPDPKRHSEMERPRVFGATAAAISA
ncbi:MAG TPA: PDZ domain-containing protein [Acidobacteriaceae bacterium]|jgi:S1-C subfamily serine protease|nr:PDZ domain-containing protein [Acidobacteriaceae bacterium]